MIQKWRWRDVPVRTKFTASIAVLVGVVSAFIYLYFPAQFERQARQALIDKSMMIARMTAYTLAPALYFDDAQAGRELLQSGIESINDVTYVVVSDTGGRIFAVYNRPDSTWEPTNEHDRHARNVYPVKVDVEFDGDLVGSLVLEHSLNRLQSEVRSAKDAVSLVSVLIFLFGIAAAAGFSRVLTNPLRRISDVAGEIARGALDKRAPTDARDEIGMLAASFNQMVDSLRDVQNQLGELNQELETRVIDRTRELRAEISERCSAEEALRASERQLSSIHDTVGDVIFLLAVETGGAFRFVSVNPAFCATTGLPIEAVVGKLVSEVIPEPSLTLVLDRYARAIRQRSIVRWEETSLYPKGRLIGEVSVAPIFDQNGKCTHLVGAVHDITARKHAEEAIEAQRLFLRRVIDTDPNLVFAKNREGKFTMVNQAVAELYGSTVEDLVGKGDADFNVNADEVERFRKADLEVIDLQKEMIIPEEPITDSQGRRRWLQTVKRPLGKDPNNQELLLGVATDITARKEAELEIRKLKLGIERSGEIIFMTDVEGNIVYVNPAFEKTYGYSAEEVLGQTPRILKSGLTGKAAYDAFWGALLSKQVVSGEIANKTKDGRILTIDSTANPVLDDQGSMIGFLAIQRDITANKLAEEALRRSEEQLRQALKMEAVGRLAGGVAHDFNNLLAVIIGQTELAQVRMGDGHPLAGSIAAIDTAAQRAADLTQQLLAFSRKQVLAPKVIDLNQIVSATEKMLRRVIGEDIELVASAAPDLWPVLADPGQIQQVVMNLVINARDAMPSGGTLIIRTTNTVLSKETTFTTGRVVAGPYVSLSVQDTGVGMDRETMTRIFEPFYTTKEAGKGTGLGLSTVLGIVEQSRGYLDVSSRVGEGTTFRIFLPPADATVKPDSQDPEKSQVSDSGGSETILIVEDEPGVREMMSSMLAMSGYKVHSCSGGQEAVALLETRDCKIDLLITDVIMPGMSGVELAIRASRVSPHLRVVYMSGYTDDVLARGGVLTEGALLLQKPFRIEVLKRIVRTALSVERKPESIAST